MELASCCYCNARHYMLKLLSASRQRAMEQSLRRSALIWCLAVAALVVAADVKIKEIGTGFEGDGAPAGWEFFANNIAGTGATARCNLSSTDSAHTGRKGARIVKDVAPSKATDENLTAEVLGPGYVFLTGRKYRMSLWMRSSCKFTGDMHWVHFPSSIVSGDKTAIKVQTTNKFKRFEAEAFLPNYTAMFRPAVAVGSAPKGCIIDIDDVQVTVDEAVEFEVLTGVSRGLTGFTRLAAPWNLAVQKPADATAKFAPLDSGVGDTFSGSELRISNPGPDPSSVQLQLATPLQLEPGYIYSTTAWLHASNNGVQCGFSWNSGPDLFRYVSGSASVFNAQKEFSIYVLPAFTVDKAQSARVHFDFGGPYMPAGSVVNVDDVIVIKAKAGVPAARHPKQEPFMSTDFEQQGDSLTFEGIATDGAQASFNLASSESASSGELGAQCAIERRPDNASCEKCIQLASVAWADEQGATYTVKYDLRSSVDGAPFSAHFVADKIGSSELSQVRYNATQEFTRYSAKVTTPKRAEIHIAIHMGAAAPGTVFDVDNVVVEKDGGPNVPLPQVSADFEPKSAQPYACLAFNRAAGSCKFDSKDEPYQGDFAAAITVAKSSPEQPWRVQLVSSSVSLTKGYTYTVTARLRSTKAGTPVQFSWNSGAPRYAVLEGSRKTVSVGTEWDIYTFQVDARVHGMYQVHFDFAGARDGVVVFVDHIVATLDW